jgi:ABC-type nitrate/sulfonate/bicarbonate transport system ATPase subunit
MNATNAILVEAARAWPHLPPESFTVAPGERVALLGPNGAGKTALLRTIAGLRAPAAGRIEVAAAPGGIGYLPQDYRASLLPWFRVDRNLTFGRRGRGEASDAETRRALDAVLEVVPLRAELLRRWPAELSGGEQQLVALARALLDRPAVLLLDEPFSALDAPTRTHLRATLGAALGGSTLLLVTHDLDDALALAVRAIVLSSTPSGLAGPTTSIPLQEPGTLRRRLEGLWA